MGQAIKPGRVHVMRMPHDRRTAIPAGEKPHPVQVCFLGLKAIPQIPDVLEEWVEHAGGTKSRCVNRDQASISPQAVFVYRSPKHRAESFFIFAVFGEDCR